MAAVATALVALAALLFLWWAGTRSDDADIRVIPDFLSPDECRAIIARAQQVGLRSSTVLAPSADAPKPKPAASNGTGRASTNAFLARDDPAAAVVAERAERLLGIPRSRFEKMQVVHYDVGEQYRQHYDACFKCDALGQDVRRTHTVLVFLNDVDEGGHTVFPNARRDVPPKAGKAVSWRNMDRWGNIIPESLHAGSPVLAGEKWACQIWVRDTRLIH